MDLRGPERDCIDDNLSTQGFGAVRGEYGKRDGGILFVVRWRGTCRRWMVSMVYVLAAVNAMRYVGRLSLSCIAREC